MHKKPLLIALCSLLGALPLTANADQTHRCGAVVDPQQRLACYDLAFPPARPVVEAAAEQAVQQFGLDEKHLASRQPSSKSNPEQINSRITQLRETSSGQRTITLENGQVWQLDGNRGALDEGDVITLRKAALGGHMAITPAGVRLRANRLQ